MHSTNESRAIWPRGFQLDCFMHDRCMRHNYLSRDNQLAAYFVWSNQTVKWPRPPTAISLGSLSEVQRAFVSSFWFFTHEPFPPPPIPHLILFTYHVQYLSPWRPRNVSIAHWVCINIADDQRRHGRSIITDIIPYYNPIISDIIVWFLFSFQADGPISSCSIYCCVTTCPQWDPVLNTSRKGGVD